VGHTVYSNNPEILNLIKICAQEAETFQSEFQSDTQTDMVQLTVALRKFANAPKEQCL